MPSWKKFELYNLAVDLAQEEDLASSNPERLAEMRDIMLGLHAEIIEDGPIWTWPAE